jgi:HAD superfamily hydrolase (TIGR01509 family)
MTSKIRAIFFDAGNTLIYPRLEVLVEDLAAQGYPATEEDFFAAERAGKAKLDEWLWPQIRKGEVPRTVDQYYWTEYLAALMERLHAPQEERTRLMLRVADGFRQITLWSRVMPETPPYLESLRGRGYFVGVISNSIGTMEEQLARLDLARYFDTVLDSAIVGVEKPNPGIFQLALARARVAPAEAIFIGDTNATDMGGAQLSGLRGVLIDRVGAYPNPGAPRITSLPELEPILERLST